MSEVRGFCRKLHDVDVDRPDLAPVGVAIATREVARIEVVPRIDRLTHYTVNKSGCWIWNGGDNTKGYGLIRLYRGPGGYRVMAHNYFYEHHVGPIPKGTILDHLCRNRRCVNPEHLEPVTTQENILRGIGLAAANAQKTKCRCGRPFDAVWKCGGGRKSRVCTKCRAAYMLKWKARRKRIVTEQVQREMQDMRGRLKISIVRIADHFGVKPSTVYANTQKKK